MNTDEKSTFDVIKHDLSRYLPIRIVLRKDESGKLSGLCENSFSMGFSETTVRIWWSGKAYSIIGEHTINGISDAVHNSKDGDIILDPLSADCPIEIDWEKWKTAIHKYDKRNAKFKLKESL